MNSVTNWLAICAGGLLACSAALGWTLARISELSGEIAVLRTYIQESHQARHFFYPPSPYDAFSHITLEYAPDEKPEDL